MANGTTSRKVPQNSHDRSADPCCQSPARPPYSPFTPTLSEANLTTVEPFHLSESDDSPNPASRSEWIDQSTGPEVDLDSNVDAIALQAAIAALHAQREQSGGDIRTLDQMKKKAHEDPSAFISTLSDSTTAQSTDDAIKTSRHSDIKELPLPQNIVRAPQIEWKKYGVIGEPLEQLHRLQQRRPGSPSHADVQDLDAVVAAPYRPFTDRLDDRSSKT